MISNPHDIASEIIAAVALDAVVITTSTDGSEIDGVVIDREAFGQARSAKAIITYKADLTEAKTLAIAANLRTSSADNMASPSDQGAAGWFAHGQGAFPSTVLATGETGGSSHRGTVEIPIDLRGASRYIQLQLTPILSATSADDVALSAVVVFGGFVDNPAEAESVATP